jgi:hypothetical protein
MTGGLLIAALGLGTSALAQTGPAEVRPISSPAVEKLEALVERFNQRRDEVYQETKSYEERTSRLNALGKEFIPQFRALAEEGGETDVAVQAWLWVLRIAVDVDKAEAKNALDTLLSEHIRSEALGELPGELRYASYSIGDEPVVGALRKLGEGSPHKSVQASALFTLGAVLLDQSGQNAKLRDEAREVFVRVSRDFGDQAYGDSTYAKEIEGYLYEVDNLQIGMVAPDFEALDENGASFKLSDYRGKVVVVDFWGFW